MSNFTDSFLSANTANFPSEQLPSLRERLAQLDDSQANQVIAAADVKNPTTALILSIFLGAFGVDRFYIGHTGLGIGKLLTTLLLPVITFGLSFFFTWIWIVVDCFLIMNATKAANLEAINTALATMTATPETVEVIEEKVEILAEPAEVIEEKVEVVAEPAEVIEEKVEVVAEPAEVIEEKVEVVAEPAEVIEEKVEVVAEPAEVIEGSVEVTEEQAD